MISKLAVEASSLASAIHVSHDYTARAIACVHELACVRAPKMKFWAQLTQRPGGLRQHRQQSLDGQTDRQSWDR